MTGEIGIVRHRHFKNVIKIIVFYATKVSQENSLFIKRENGKPFIVLGSILFDCPSVGKKSRKKSDKQSVCVGTTVYFTTRVSLMTSLSNDMHAIFPSLLASFIRGSRAFRFSITLAEKSSLKKIPLGFFFLACRRTHSLSLYFANHTTTVLFFLFQSGLDKDVVPAQCLSSTPFLLLIPML